MSSDKKQGDDLRESVNEIFLAGLGALSKAEEEGSKLFQKLVSKGAEYDGPGAEQIDALRSELQARAADFRDRTIELQLHADSRADRARAAATEGVERARRGLDSVLGGVEERIESAVASAIHRLGVPTRGELEALQRSLDSLGERIEAGATRHGGGPLEIDVRASGNDLYEVRVAGLVVDRVHGETAAMERAAELRRQQIAGGDTGPGEVTVEATGGGWYEIRVDGVAVDKVQGRRAADAAVTRIKMNR